MDSQPWPVNSGRQLVVTFVDAASVDHLKSSDDIRGPLSASSSGAAGIPITVTEDVHVKAAEPLQEAPKRPRGIATLFARATQQAFASAAQVTPVFPSASTSMVVSPPDSRQEPTETTPVEEQHVPPPVPTIDVDSLFCKTKTTPVIYYRPLTDEEVAAKRAPAAGVEPIHPTASESAMETSA
jgi:apoptotic chromatin condensation inducer in the nucleus